MTTGFAQGEGCEMEILRAFLQASLGLSEPRMLDGFLYSTTDVPEALLESSENTG